MRYFKVFVFALIALLFSACGNKKNDSTNTNGTSTTTHKLKIVSLVPSITKEIVRLGLKDNIIGATSYCDISKDNPELIVGSALEVNEEKIILLKPDIVFASTLVKDKSIAILKKNGIRVEYAGKYTSFDEICRNFEKLSTVLNRKNKALQIISKAKLKIDSLEQNIPDNKVGESIFFQLGANPIATVIPNTFMNDFISFSKCKNIFQDLDKLIVSRESVVLRNPDIIIISLMGGVGAQEKENWEKYKSINAVKNDRIFTVNSASTPTVKDFVDNLEIIIKKIYFEN